MAITAAWGRKCALTIDRTKVLEDLTDFPVCLTIANVPSEMVDLDGANRANTDGSDIRITTDSAGATECPLEVVVCSMNNDPSLSLLEIHTKLPSVSTSVDTVFYIWYKNSAASAYAATDTYGRNNVWDSNYVYVSHCQSNACVDSKGVHSDGTPRDSVTTGAGIVQNGLDHSTYNKYTSIPDNSETRMGNLWTADHGFAVEAWSKTAADFDPDNITGFQKRHMLVSKGQNWNANYRQHFAFGWFEEGSTKLGIEFRFPGGFFDILTCQGTSWTTSTQYYTAVRMTKLGAGNRKYTFVVHDSSSFKTEAEQTAPNDYDNTVSSGLQDTMNIGAHRENQLSNYMNWTDGGMIIDEVRISKFERSVNWLKTTYQTVGSPATFITEGTPESTTTIIDSYIDDGIMGGIMRGMRFMF